MRKPQRMLADDESLSITTEIEDDGFGDFGLFLEEDDEDEAPEKSSTAFTNSWNLPSSIDWEQPHILRRDGSDTMV